VPHVHLGLQRVDVDAVDGGPGGRPVHRGDPRHVAVDGQDHVGLHQDRVLRHGVVLETGVQLMVGREVHVIGHRLKYTDGQQLA
jgi:hypothetical protein